MVEALKDVRKFSILILCVFITIFIFKTAYNLPHSQTTAQTKQSISNATITQLDNVSGIGTVLSNRIHDYVKDNHIDSVDELQGHIQGLGEVKLKELKEVYK